MIRCIISVTANCVDRITLFVNREKVAEKLIPLEIVPASGIDTVIIGNYSNQLLV